MKKSNITSQKDKILLIEDDPHLVPLITEVFKLGAYDYTYANNGSDAIKKFERYSPDLVVSDIQLPDINGIDLFKLLHDKNPHIPYIFLTSQESEIDIVLALELGAEEYITKPFKPRELLTRIKKVLQRTNSPHRAPQKSETPASTRPEGLCIIEETKEVRIDDQVLDMSVKEFDVFYHLFNHPGQIFSRNHLLERFWSDNFDVNDRIIDSHISHIRQKLTPYQEHIGQIKTHRGRGYSFEKASNT